MQWTTRTTAILLLGLSIFGPVSRPSDVLADTPAMVLLPDEIDLGWNGTDWNKSFPAGSMVTLMAVRRCAGTGEPCRSNADCAGANCLSTCDPLVENVCELSGPSNMRRCLQTMDQCNTNADCGSSECVHLAAPPTPSTADGVPVCVTNIFERDVTGSYDFSSGHSSLSLSLRRRVHLGFTREHPCPVCGERAQDPKIGDQFVCLGGPNSGSPCLVSGVSPTFGGVSYDCPPNPHANISGPGISLRIRELTTRSVSARAKLPCGAPYDALHPDNGPSVCLDDFSACSTNADCKRCENDPSLHCLNDSECTGTNRCVSAPDIPASCGVYCHCGYCGGDPGQPCFADTECSPPDHCVSGNQVDAPPQRAPNACSGLLCGVTHAEECCALGDGGPCTRASDTPRVGSCSLAAYQPCRSDGDCNTTQGTCILTNRPCFENLIRRSGSPAPADGSSYLTYVGLTCVPETASAAINVSIGLPGPAALRLRGSPLAAASPRCGNGFVEPGEQCDGGPCCTESCRYAPIGTPCSQPSACRLPGRCAMGLCVRNPEGKVDCSDDNDCTADSCDTATGDCVHVKQTGTSCDDGDPATVARCDEGTCVASDTLCPDTSLPAAACESADRSVLRVVRQVDRDVCSVDCCDDDPALHNRLVWKWVSASRAPTLPCDAVATGESYQLCIYDDNAGSQTLAAVVDYPHWEVGGTRRAWCWYADDATCVAGPQRLRLRNASKGRRLRLGHALRLGDLLPVSSNRMFEKNPAVSAQMVSSSGNCWSSRFSKARKNTARVFRARSRTNRLPQ